MKTFLSLKGRKKLLLVISLAIYFPLKSQSLKSVSILGDSYSTFENYMLPDTNFVWYYSLPKQDTDVRSVKETWWYQFIKENNFKLEQNNSFSGSTICNTGYRKEDYTDRSFITRMKKLGSPDIILIFGATNDNWAKAPLGDFIYSGWTDNQLYSFRPAMAFMFDYMLGRYPNVEIFFVLNSELEDTINDSAKTICDYYKIPCIELKEIDKKSGHPSIEGMRQINKQISTYISEYFQKN